MTRAMYQPTTPRYTNQHHEKKEQREGTWEDAPHHSFRIQNLHFRISFQLNIPRFNISFSSASSVRSSSAICSGDL